MSREDIAWGRECLARLKAGQKIRMPNVGADLVLMEGSINIVNCASWYNGPYHRPRLQAIFRHCGVETKPVMFSNN
jgi:hypothetical protein